VNIPEKVLLRCPVCGAEAFYVEKEGVTVSFSVNEAYGVEDLSPEDAALVLNSDTEVYCTVCSWHGAIRELERPE